MEEGDAHMLGEIEQNGPGNSGQHDDGEHQGRGGRGCAFLGKEPQALR